MPTTFRYVQLTGDLYALGSPFIAPIAGGYSGYGSARNNPDLQCVARLGPIPRGWYTMSPAFEHPQLGPTVIRLTPHPENDMCGRDGFLIHGDSTAAPGTASEGCIILDPTTRSRLAAAISEGANQLEVVRA